MDFFDSEDSPGEEFEAFLNYICRKNTISKQDLLYKFREACIRQDVHSPIYVSMINVFPHDAFMASTFTKWETKMSLLCKLFEYLISNGAGLDVFGKQLKEYDYSAACGLVWTNNYFAYRCRTCGLSPTMSLCTDCFNAGNHEGHDFNKFKSHAGGVCDCGDASVIKASGNCRFHGPDKVDHRPTPPRELIAAFETLLIPFLKALLFFLMHVAEFMNRQDSLWESNGENFHALHLLQRLQSYGWIPQKLFADALLDSQLFRSFKESASNTDQLVAYQTSLDSKPSIRFPECVLRPEPTHKCMMDAYLFLLIKLKFAEPLVTFVIGLFSIDSFKETFADSYLDHYSRIASSIMLAACTKQSRADECLHISNRIIHVSVQLFSGEYFAFKMAKERQLHQCIASCLLRIFEYSLTTLDDLGHRVVNPDSVLIRNNVFWPMMSDMINLLAHKTIVDLLLEDQTFLVRWTKILRYMQFANCFFMKEGNHIEYETMGFYHTYTMELEISVNTLWNIWSHYSKESDQAHCLQYTKACLECLAGYLSKLGNIVQQTSSSAITARNNPRSPLSFHTPLMRHSACFLALASIKYKVSLVELLNQFLKQNAVILRRWMQEASNILLGSHEVMIGYWIRNGHPIRQSVSHYLQTQFCYSYVDLDIFAMQMCASMLPPAHVLNSLIDETKLLRNINFHQELLNLVADKASESEVAASSSVSEISVDRKPMALESWLVNLSWILDLRNNLQLDESVLMRKELVYCLASGSRKRSDLTSLIPERYSVSSQLEVDPLLEQVANFSGPSVDEAAGSTRPGEYALKPHLWHEEFDPVFHSLRCSSRSDTSHTLDRYRDHFRQAHGVKQPANLWPPYRIPAKLPEQYAQLDSILQSRHLHYMLFSQLAMYVYDSKLVTEEALALIVHLLNRAVHAALSNDLSITQEPSDLENEPFEEDETELNVEESGKAPLLEERIIREIMTDDFRDQTALAGPRFLVYRMANNLVSHGPRGPTEEELLYNRLTASPDTEEAIPESSDDFEDRVPYADESPGSSRRPKHVKMKEKRVHWNIALRACPYRNQAAKLVSSGLIKSDLNSTGTILDNIVTRLCSVMSPNPQVFQIDSKELYKQSLLDKPRLVDSIISLLIKAHTKLHYSYIESAASNVGCKGPLQFTTHFPIPDDQPKSKINRSSMSLPIDPVPACLRVFFTSQTQWQNFKHEKLEDCDPDLLYFVANPPIYKTPKDKIQTNAKRSDKCSYCNDKDWGDGVFYIEQLLDKIYTAREDLAIAIETYLQRARNPLSVAASSKLAEKMEVDPQPQTTADDQLVGPEGLKKAAELKREKIKNAMLRKQKAFTDKYADLIAAMSVPSDVTGESCDLEHRVSASTKYECAICQTENPPNNSTETDPSLPKFDLVLLGMLCESGLMQQMREIGRPVELRDSRLQTLKYSLAGKAADPDGPLIVGAHTPRPSDSTGKPPNKLIMPSAVIESGGSSLDFERIRESYDVTDFESKTIERATTASNPNDSWDDTQEMSSTGTKGEHYVYLDVRQWWKHAFGARFSPGFANMSVLESPSMQAGLLIQTCGHAVHQTCLLSYKSTSTTRSWPGRNRASLLCPLCRRDIHHTLPIFINPPHGAESSLNFKNLPRTSSSYEQLLALNQELFSLPVRGISLWQSLGSSEDHLNEQRRKVIRATVGKQLNAVVLLRAQLETELSVLMTCPLQYTTVARRCHWNEFLNYLRNLYGEASEFNALVAKLLGLPAPSAVDLRLPSNVTDASVDPERPVTAPAPRLADPYLHRQFSIIRRGATRRRASAAIPDQLNMPEAMELDDDDMARVAANVYGFVADNATIDSDEEWLQPLNSETEPQPAHLRKVARRRINSANSVSKQYLFDLPLLFLEPGDVFLALVPTIWPREDLYLTWVKAIIGLNFTRILIGLCLNQPECASMQDSLENCAKCIERQKSNETSNWSASLIRCFELILQRLAPIYKDNNSPLTRPDPSFVDLPRLGAQLETISLETGLTYNGQLLDNRLPRKNDFEGNLTQFIAARMLPLMRLATLCLERWQSSSTPNWSDAVLALPFVGMCKLKSSPLHRESSSHAGSSAGVSVAMEHTHDVVAEFVQLSSRLQLTQTASEIDFGQLFSNSFAVYEKESAGERPLVERLQRQLDIWMEPINKLVLETSSDASPSSIAINSLSKESILPWLRNLGSVMEIGRQLYAPKLIRPPEMFDQLFNELHAVPCATTTHRHHENALCLICGRLICIVCSQTYSFVEHAYLCDGFAGIVLEINTSLVYVSLGAFISDWGSIYLDAYGEEDPHLKRGKPLYLNHQRLDLLEQQWLTHSFRHVLKNWKSPNSV